MFNGSNCDRKSQFSGILTEPLNPRDFKDVPTVPAYFMAIHLFLQKKETQKFSFKKNITFNKEIFILIL